MRTVIAMDLSPRIFAHKSKTIKKSGYWIKEVAAANKVEIADQLIAKLNK